MAGLKPLRTLCGVLVLLSVAGAKDDAKASVKTPYINEYGSGWFFSLAAGSTGLYASDHSLNCIRKLEAETGVWQQWAGECASDSAGHRDGLRGAAKFKQPRSMCINPKGQLIVADQGNHCIRAVSPEGVVSTYAGVCGKAGDVDGNAAEALFSDVWDVQCLDNCSVLVAEPGSGRIRTIQDSSGTCPDPAGSTAGNEHHWLKQKSMWATLVAVAVAGVVMGSAITFFADAQAAKRHTALLNNMERYQSLGGSHQVNSQCIPSSTIAYLGSCCAEGKRIPLHASSFLMSC
ncbi:TPA: hypothetical protein ACH3X1_008771 [Trebouxia sp. C0004]